MADDISTEQQTGVKWSGEVNRYTSDGKTDAPTVTSTLDRLNSELIDLDESLDKLNSRVQLILGPGPEQTDRADGPTPAEPDRAPAVNALLLAVYRVRRLRHNLDSITHRIEL